LSAKASPAYGLVRPRALAPAADPLRLSAGGAYTAPPQALTSYVAPWFDSESFSSAPFASARPRAPDDEDQKARPAYTARPLGQRRAYEPERLRSLRPHLTAGWIASDQLNRKSARDPNTLLQLADARLVTGDGPPQPAARFIASAPKRRRSSTRRCFSPISAADMLSRVPAETPHSQASGSRLSDRRNLFHASPRAFARASTRHRPRRRRIAVAGIFGPGQRRS
jgi:hypothetical protein